MGEKEENGEFRGGQNKTKGSNMLSISKLISYSIDDVAPLDTNNNFIFLLTIYLFSVGHLNSSEEFSTVSGRSNKVLSEKYSLIRQSHKMVSMLVCRSRAIATQQFCKAQEYCTIDTIGRFKKSKHLLLRRSVPIVGTGRHVS